MLELALTGGIVTILLLTVLFYWWRGDIKEYLNSQYDPGRSKQAKLGLLAFLLLMLMGLFFKNWPAGILAVCLVIIGNKRRDSLKRSRDNVIIEGQAEVALQLIAALYENNRDIIKSLDDAADCIQPPLSEELKFTVAEYNAGGSPLQALENLAQRVDNRDIRAFVKGVILSEQYGTDTVQVVQDVSMMISDRITLRGEVKNEIRGQTFNITVFLFAIPVIITVLLIFFPDARPVFTEKAIGKFVMVLMLLVEYFAWHFATGQEMRDLI